MKTRTIAICLAWLVAAGCSTAPKSDRARLDLISNARSSLDQMVSAHPEISDVMTGSYGYAVFPGVGAGGFVVGGSYGRGVVYQGDKMVGYSRITSVSAGAKAGGQSYDELIVFEDKEDFDSIVSDKLSLTANASVVVLQPGVAASKDFREGVEVFVQPRGGAMVDASVGGQSFSFEPVK